MADPFRNELEGAMARADRAEHEAARLRNELAIAKAPPPPQGPAPAAPPRSPVALIAAGAALLMLSLGIGMISLVRRSSDGAGAAASPTATDYLNPPEAPWSRGGPVVSALERLGLREGVSLGSFECRPIVGAVDPNGFMCRGYANDATRDKLAGALGLSPLPTNVRTPPSGCAALPMYSTPQPVVRYAPVGAAPSPQPSEATVQVLYTRAGQYDVCFEIDYSGK